MVGLSFSFEMLAIGCVEEKTEQEILQEKRQDQPFHRNKVDKEKHGKEDLGEESE
jgi:hypothetical protein